MKRNRTMKLDKDIADTTEKVLEAIRKRVKIGEAVSWVDKREDGGVLIYRRIRGGWAIEHQRPVYVRVHIRFY